MRLTADAHTLQRQLHALGIGTSTIAGAEVPLERLVAREPPRSVDADVLEHDAMRAVAVRGEPTVGVRAFLDGTQASRIVSHDHGVPLVLGVSAAVVRERRDRRLATWDAPIVERRLYASVDLLPPRARARLADLPYEVVNVTSDAIRGGDLPHPWILRDLAVHQVQSDRERVEQELAARWCDHETDVLFIDGGISGSEPAASSTSAIGVVKSHRTLYAKGDAMRTVLALRQGERSSVLRITSPKRTTVASWYLRLRDATERDPMWGLVRVEVAMPADSGMPRADAGTPPGTSPDDAGSPASARGREALSARANAVSRWVLAEVSPLALPDGRWDTLMYGVRDCEEFLRAIT